MSISEVKQQDPDPLATIRYACIYWVDHFEDYPRHKTGILEASEQLLDINSLSNFMCNSLLHWIEALSFFEKLVGRGHIYAEAQELAKSTWKEKTHVSFISY